MSVRSGLGNPTLRNRRVSVEVQPPACELAHEIDGARNPATARFGKDPHRVVSNFGTWRSTTSMSRFRVRSGS
jgi:hypothetical protein